MACIGNDYGDHHSDSDLAHHQAEESNFGRPASIKKTINISSIAETRTKVKPCICNIDYNLKKSHPTRLSELTLRNTRRNKSLCSF